MCVRLKNMYAEVFMHSKYWQHRHMHIAIAFKTMPMLYIGTAVYLSMIACWCKHAIVCASLPASQSKGGKRH